MFVPCGIQVVFLLDPAEVAGLSSYWYEMTLKTKYIALKYIIRMEDIQDVVS